VCVCVCVYCVHCVRTQLCTFTTLCNCYASPLRSRCRHVVFWLPVSECMRVYILKACEHDILQTAFGNFIRFTSSVQLVTKMNRLEYCGQRSRLQRDHVWSKKHFGIHFLSPISGIHGRNVMKLIIVTHCQVLMTLGHRFKGQERMADNVFRKFTFAAEAHGSTVRG